MLHILEHEIHVARRPRRNQPLQLDNVWMVKSAKDCYLPSHEANTLGLKIVEPNLLKSNYLSGLQVTSPEYSAISTLTDLFKYI